MYQFSERQLSGVCHSLVKDIQGIGVGARFCKQPANDLEIPFADKGKSIDNVKPQLTVLRLCYTLTLVVSVCLMDSI